MTFSVAPRSRSPVLSIRTRRHDERNLRAEIEAASTQQQKLRTRRVRSSAEPSIPEESQDHDHSLWQPYANSGADTVQNHKSSKFQQQQQQQQQSNRRSFSNSVKSISGTVRGEFSTAKRFLKDTSLRKFQRIGHRASTGLPKSEVSSEHTLESESGISNCAYLGPAELSSDPLYQLEDSSRSSAQYEIFEIHPSPLPDYEKDCRQEVQDGYHRLVKSGDLSSKSYACDNCEQPICGGDLYDFCAMCSPSDRVLCIMCARERKCWRHRSDANSIDKLASARASPAPPYTHTGDRRRSAEEHIQRKPLRQPSAIQSVAPAVEDDPSDNASHVQASGTSPHALAEKNASGHDPSADLMAVMRQFLEMQAPKASDMQSSLQSRETAIREQYAALREERMAIKEQELLVREREYLSRERDALVIRNLQTLVAVQELSRNGSLTKANDNIPQSFDGAGLAHLRSAAAPRNKEHDFTNHTIARGTEGSTPPAMSGSDPVPDAHGARHIRTRPGGKRKQGQMSPASSDSQPPSRGSSNGNASRTRKARQNSSDDCEDDSENERNTPPKKQKQDPIDLEGPQRIFACPYSKYDPVRYSPRNLIEKHYRGCSGHFLHDISRLKQHLKRVHWRPEHHCPRCFEVFSGPRELDQHHERIEGCPRRECPFPEKMDKVQQKQIHVKRPKETPEKLWYILYKALFPGSPLPESPYIEDDEISPPVSAAPPSSYHEEAAQRMLQIMNDRLDKHKGQPGQDWLRNSASRQLINAEIAESMIELFGKMSLHSAPASDACISAPTSAIVSPVTPPSAYGTTGVLIAAASEHELDARFAESLYTRSAPLLKPPKQNRSRVLTNPDIAISPAQPENRMPEVNYGPMVSKTTSFNLPSARRDDFPDDAIATQESQHFAQHASTNLYRCPSDAVDEGWDHESGSYSKGDDLKAMETGMQASLMQGTETQSGQLAAPQPIKPRRRLCNFVPVRLETLDDHQPGQAAATSQLHANKSVASLVDSGYGSGNSVHPGLRAAQFDEDVHVSDDISPIGHTSFLEEFDMLQGNGGSINPWESEEFWDR